MLTIDFETYWDKDFSLSKMTTESYIRAPQFEVIGVSIKKDNGPIEWVSGDDQIIKQALLERGAQNDVCVAHNAAFDMAIMNWRYGIRPRVIVDTLSMSRPITGLSVGGSLRALGEYFGIGEKGTEVYNTQGKHRKDFTPEELERYGRYCQQDVNLTYQLLQKLLPLSTAQEMYLIDLTIRMFTEPVLQLNSELLETHLEKVKADKQALLDSVAHGDRSAFMSNDKFAELLRAEGVEPPTKVSEKTGKTAYAFAKTDAGFQALLDHPNERVQALASARLGLKSTLEETRTQAFLDIARRGPMPVMLNYYGAANTGRMSGGDGTNPQNLPRGGALREAICPPEGYTLVACDSSQIEARTLAWFAGQNDLVEAFANGEDIYSKFASSVYGKPINKHEHPEERHVGKTCILGLGYGTGALKLHNALANGFIKVYMPQAECDRIVKLYRSQYDAIPRLWKDCQNAIANMYNGYDSTVGVAIRLPVSGADHTILLPNGMKLRYPDLKCETNDRGFPEYSYQKKRFRARLYGGALTENLIQSLARIIVAYQMCKIKQELDKTCKAKADGKIRRVVHMVHDEVIVVVPDEEAQEVKHMMETIMSTPPKWAPTLPVSCEAGLGKTYGEAK
jgi:DNA polymerase I-3'-5' exonuclease and polymerase domains